MTDIQPTMSKYTTLVTELDQAIAANADLHRDRLQCRPGCSDCCRPFSVLAVEVARIETALAALAPATLAGIRDAAARQSQACPFLVNDLCAIYQYRPLICRTQGLPIAYVDHQRETIEVSACPINFPEDEEFFFSEENLFFMDSFNERLTVINRDFCTQQGVAGQHRIPFQHLLTLSNNS